MQKDVYSENYEELLQILHKQNNFLSNLPEDETKQQVSSILAGAEELLLRWDEIGINFGKPVTVLLNESERLLISISEYDPKA